MVLLGVAGAADSVAPAAILGDVVAGRGGTVVAVYQMAGDLGSILGPVTAGALADAHGYGRPSRSARRSRCCPLPFLLVARETLTRHAPADAEAATPATPTG